MELEEFLPLMHALDPTIKENHVKWSFDAAGGRPNTARLTRDQFAHWGRSTFEDYTNEELESQIKELLETAATLTDDELSKQDFLAAAREGEEVTRRRPKATVASRRETLLKCVWSFFAVQ